jgi:hypothetical protein
MCKIILLELRAHPNPISVDEAISTILHQQKRDHIPACRNLSTQRLPEPYYDTSNIQHLALSRRPRPATVK